MLECNKITPGLTTFFSLCKQNPAPELGGTLKSDESLTLETALEMPTMFQCQVLTDLY